MESKDTGIPGARTECTACTAAQLAPVKPRTLPVRYGSGTAVLSVQILVLT